jgi:hypothetical protein
MTNGEDISGRAVVRVGSTGGRAERFEKLPIATTPGRVRKVGLWLGPDEGQPRLPEIRRGDRLLVSAEFQLTTDCKAAQSDCVQAPYTYKPYVTSQLLLTADPALTRPGERAVAITEPRREQLSHERHHHVIVYDHKPYVVRELPWEGKLYLSLVLSAHHPSARPNQILIVGQNDPGGVIVRDMATLSAVRLRGLTQSDAKQHERRRLENRSIPVVKGERRVVYTQPLEGLKKGEQLSIRSRVESSAQGLRGPARASVRVFLADSEADTGPGEHAKQVSASRADISRKNGTNRLPRESRGTSVKAGVLRITKDPEKTLFVNTLLETGDPLKVARPGDALKLLDGGFQRVARYKAELDG